MMDAEDFELQNLQDDKEAKILLEQNKNLAELLRSLQRPWANEDLANLDDIIEGKLYKKNRNGKWKLLYFVLSGNQLCYYAKKEVFFC